MKKGSVVTLICALAVPVLHLTNTQAADTIDTADCAALTVKVDKEFTTGDFKEDLGQMDDSGSAL